VDIEIGKIARDALIGVVSGVGSAYVTLHFALKRFYFEKWWERKAEAYSSILDALHHLKNHVEHELAFLRVEPSLRPAGEEVLSQLTEKMISATAEIRKRADIGSFVISEEAVSAMRTLQTELDRITGFSEGQQATITDLPEHFRLRLSAVNKCLDSMRDIAKNDLKLPMTTRECIVRLIDILKRRTK